MNTSRLTSSSPARTACVFLMCCSFFLPVTHSQRNTNQESREKSARVDAFVANATAAMPEVAADLLIKVAESRLLSDRQKRIELLEEAFRRSGDVQEKTRQKMWAGSVDSRGGYLSAAFDQQLDALSIRCRVVRAMLNLDPERARKLFSEIPKLKVTELTCRQSLAYDMTDFYQTLSLVASRTISAAEIQQGERLRFIQSYVETLQSPAQVSPILKLLIESGLSAPELSVVGKSLSSALGRMSADPRSFFASMLHGKLIANVDQLLTLYREHDLPATELVSSFQSYLLAQLNSVQCRDVAASKSKTQQIWASLDRFNSWLNEPIKPSDIKPSRIEDVDADEQFWTSSQSFGLLMKLKALRFGDQEVPLTIEARASNDWQQKMDLLAADVDQWDGTSEKNPLTYFHEKANLYNGMFELAPTNESKLRVLLKFAGYLRGTNAKEHSHIEWLLHLHGLLKKIKLLEPSDRTRIFDVFRNSGDQALQLYSDYDLLLTRVAPKSQGGNAIKNFMGSR